MKIALAPAFPIDVFVEDRVRLEIAKIPDDCAEAIRDAFTHRNRGGDGVPYEEETWTVEDKFLSLPRAGLGRVRAALRAAKVSFRLRDLRTHGNFALLDARWGGKIPRHRVQLWAQQEPCVEASIERQNCIIRAHTGAGKSTIALATAARIGVPAIVIVSTGGLHEQWVARTAEELGVSVEDVGIIGDGKFFTAPITIAMQQTLANGIPLDVLRAFGAVFCDELQIFGAPTFFAAVDKWPAVYRIGYSSNETRKDGKEYMIYDLFGEVAATITEAEVIATGKVVDVEVRVVPTTFAAPGYRQSMMSGNKFQMHAAHRKLISAMCADERRNAIVRGIVRDEVASGEQCVVFSERVDHCTQLDREFAAMGIQSGTMLGGKEGKRQFGRTKDGLLDGTVRVGVGTISAIGVGQDFPSVAVGVLTTPKSNNKQQLGQIKGRLCRACEATGKTKGVLYVLYDREIYGRKAIENFVRWFPTVVVKDGDRWIDAQEFLESMPRGIRNKDLTGTPTADELLED